MSEKNITKEPTYKADVPTSLITSDKVSTELLGELTFWDGMPSDNTVNKSYDFLDTARAAEVFLNGMPAVSLYSMLDDCIMFHYYATSIPPAMKKPRLEKGSAYDLTAHDSRGQYLEG